MESDSQAGPVRHWSSVGYQGPAEFAQELQSKASMDPSLSAADVHDQYLLMSEICQDEAQAAARVKWAGIKSVGRAVEKAVRVYGGVLPSPLPSLRLFNFWVGEGSDRVRKI